MTTATLEQNTSTARVKADRSSAGQTTTGASRPYSG